MLTAIFGLLILGTVLYISMRMLGNVFYGLLLIGMIFTASFLLIGSFPELREVPIIGAWIPDLPWLPSTTGEAISVIRSVFYRLDIIGYGRTSDGNLLVVVANRGRMELSGFNATVDGQNTDVINSQRATLASGELAVLELGWRGGFDSINIESGSAIALYPES